MAKPLIPFWMTPTALNLTGQAREEAKARYELTGIERDKKLAEIALTGDALAKRMLEIDIQYDRLTPQQRDLAKLRIEGRENDTEALVDLRVRYGEISREEGDEIIIRHRYPEGPARELELLKNRHLRGQISDHQYALARIEFTHPEGVERDVARLDLRLANHELTKLQYDKEVATLREEPWIGIIDSGFDPEKGVSGVFFEFDWNEQWITYLRENGYSGPSDAAVVDGWFIDVCRAQGFGIGPNDVIPFGR